MERLHCMRKTVAFFFLVQWVTSDSSSLSIVATCSKSEDETPREMFMQHESNPSPLHELTAELNESQGSVIIRWSINIDTGATIYNISNNQPSLRPSSIRSLTGTWISFFGMSDLFYRCQYQPPFTSEQINLTGQEQLWFSFTVLNVPVCPLTNYHVIAYNLPTPNKGGNEYSKKAEIAKVQWDVDIYSVLHGDKIVVSFNTSHAEDKHIIGLINRTGLLKTVEKAQCKECTVALDYMENMGPCEDLIIQIASQKEQCQAVIKENETKVVCPKRSYLNIGVGCVLALLFLLLCCCVIDQIFRRTRGSRRTWSVRVLVVYPAVDGVFQRSVMLLAERLQSCGGLSVVIDVWERGHLAEQGPLRWLNSQADLADRVLFVLPPPRTQTDSLKSKLFSDVSDDAVSASAGNLFALALNLVTSAAHDPHARDKFWVINLEHNEKSAQTELRGCRMFVLPRDLKKLHRQLLSGAVQSPALPRCFRSFYFKHALEQLEINTDLPPCTCQSD